MTFANFELDGEDLILPLFEKDKIRCAMLTAALEDVVSKGAGRATLVAGREDRVAIYLVPARFLLQAVPSAAALLRADYAERLLEILEVIADYVDERDWQPLERRARDALD